MNQHVVRLKVKTKPPNRAHILCFRKTQPSHTSQVFYPLRAKSSAWYFSLNWVTIFFAMADLNCVSTISQEFKVLRGQKGQNSTSFTSFGIRSHLIWSTGGREPWYGGYGWRLMFERLWVWIPVLYTRWTFGHLFTLSCCKNCIFCLKRPKINKKEAWVGPF